MLTVKETQEELSKDVDKLYNKPGKGKKEQDYLKHGAVALAMNKAFTQLGWDCVTDEMVVLKPAYRCNSAGKEDPAGTYFSAIAQAKVTVKARSLLRSDGTFVETIRTCTGVGQAVGGKSTTEFDAFQNAITSAETQAFKRACRYFGPSTGLTLTFDPGEREAIQAQIEQAQQAEKIKDGGPAAIEGPAEVSNDAAETPASVAAPAADVAPTAATAQTPAAPATTQTPAAAVPSNGTGLEVPEVLRNLHDQAVLNRIAALASDEAAVPAEDVRAFQITLAATFEKHGALGIWKTAGLPYGVGSVVKRSCLNSVAQVLEEAGVAPGGMEGFLAKFKAAPAAAAPATTAPAAAATPAPAAAATPAPQGPTATVIMNGKHVAGPAPTVPGPGKTTVEPSVAGAAPAHTNGNGNGASHGEQMQQMWDESELGKKDRLQRYNKKFGSVAPEVVTILTETPDDAEVSREIAGKVHGLGLSIYSKLNMPSNAFELWSKVGYTFGQGQPKGKHLRQFADALPE